MQLIDIGANLTHPAFHSDLPEVLSRAHRAGVTAIVVTGTSVAESVNALKTSSAWPETLYATAGVHPHHARECDGTTIAALRVLAAAARGGDRRMRPGLQPQLFAASGPGKMVRRAGGIGL